MMRCLTASLLLLCACSCTRSGDDTRQYELQGVVRAVDVENKRITIAHGEVKGLMPGMTMPFEVRDPGLIAERIAGDEVKGTLVVLEDGAYLSTLEKTGTQPVAAAPEPAPAASSGFELIKVGQPLDEITFIDQDGNRRPLSRYRGSALALTFMYTRCPLPAFCPLMDQQFARVQSAIGHDSKLAGQVQLLSITLDPAFDTPAVLKRHSEKLRADPKVWTFATGDRDDIDKLGNRLGLLVTREGSKADDITHSLRTAVLDREGRLQKVFQGNEWTPDQVVSEIRRALGS
jgi:protein SCO1/2